MLNHSPLFNGLPDIELSALEHLTIQRHFSRGDTIINAGDSSDAMYVIQSGRVKVIMSDINGKEVILSTLGANAYFGEMALLDDQPRSATVVAMENSTLFMLSRESFNHCMDKYPSIARHVMHELVARLRHADNKIGSLALVDVYGRMVDALKDLAVTTEHGQHVIPDKPAHQDIANMVGASREMVGKMLKEMQFNGSIIIEKNVIVLLPKLLNYHADGETEMPAL